MSLLGSILATLHAATTNVLGTSPAPKLAPLNEEALAFVETTIAPALHIPPHIIAVASGANISIDAAAEPYERAALEFLQVRLSSLLGAL